MAHTRIFFPSGIMACGTVVNHKQISNLFNQVFADEHVQLVGGAEEPLYQPAGVVDICRSKDRAPALIHYREDFAASALHEVAHWCIAGPERRQQIDFGYRYIPPPRSIRQQEAFYRSELRTQALESLFADAAGLVFQVSADDLEADISEFSCAVESSRQMMRDWMDNSTDDRARRFYGALENLSQDLTAQQRNRHG